MSTELHLVGPRPPAAGAPPRSTSAEGTTSTLAAPAGHTRMPRPVGVEDLKSAWASASGARAIATWAPGANEHVLPVIGGLGSAGTTTVALALAHASASPTRVVECCARSSSGLPGACHAELGAHAGWLRGTRDHLLLERSATDAWSPSDLPAPPPFPAPGPKDAGPGTEGDPVTSEATGDVAPVGPVGVRTVLDVGWRSGELLSAGSWLPTAACSAPVVLVVVAATEPGLRRLEATLLDLGEDRVVAAVVGPRLRRWSPRLRGCRQPLTERLLRAERLVPVPVDPMLAVTGITERPLPARVLAAGHNLLRTVEDLSSGSAAGDRRVE